MDKVSKKDLHVVSFSGGKDSTAMLLHMLEIGMSVDVILFCDTSVEFPSMYEHIRKVGEYIGRQITVLKNEKGFEYYLMEHIPKKKDGSIRNGYSFPDSRSRWCTTILKTDIIKRYISDLKKDYNVIEYVGIAYDEGYRLERENNKRENVVFPLFDWKWTEMDALQYCYSKGFEFDGLYELFNRLSCWCCPLKSLDEYRILRKEFPKLWSKLLDWQKDTWRKFRADYSVFDLDIRFQFEEEKLSRGESITNRQFYDELKLLLGSKG